MLGWNTVLHYGSLMGAYSLLTLLPELRLGIFTSYNGAVQTDPYTINFLLHVHLIDIFLGAQPSVDNATHWCSSQPRRHNPDETLTLPLRLPVSMYTGVYWHSVLGQFDVWDDGKETLMARYGSVELTLRAQPSGVFSGVPTDQAWLLLIRTVYVQFSTLNGDQLQYRHVRVGLLRRTTFKRRNNSGVDRLQLSAHIIITTLLTASSLR